jgi:hypothetical protein
VRLSCSILCCALASPALLSSPALPSSSTTRSSSRFYPRSLFIYSPSVSIFSYWHTLSYCNRSRSRISSYSFFLIAENRSTSRRPSSAPFPDD